MKFKQYITELSKKISAAVFMTDGEKFLAILPTNHKKWEIPKGQIDDGESPVHAAMREFYEETGQKINIKGLRKVGTFYLHETKDVILYTYSIENLPSVSSLKCLSFFQDKNNKTIPEISKYKIIKNKDVKKYIRPEMHKMLEKALK